MEGSAWHTAWRSLRRAGLVAPELPSVAFIAVATSSGFRWGLVAAGLLLAAVLVVRLVRALPVRAVLGGAAGLAVTATIARITGVAASGLLTDIGTDLTIGVVLAASVAVRRPLFGILWRGLRRRSPVSSRPDRVVLRGYSLTTALAAAVLLVRGSLLAAVYVAGEPVAWLLGVKFALGLPGTLLVIAAFYAAGSLEDAP
ncbi:DUF3159 domain-containing protein [Nostocoides japonicum]|uniref:DUF3159 domain-containing protein n=1 Tax=Nostocoides japonicum TaxID=99481 RepID=UPI00069D2F4C|nr:DUF3159 domain-containing protein [Tetrasphaera japonica]